MRALAETDVPTGLARFDAVFWTHVVHTLRTARRAGMAPPPRPDIDLDNEPPRH